MTDYSAMSDADLRAENDALTRECLAAWHRKRDADKAWEALCDRKAAVTLELTRRDVMPRKWQFDLDDTLFT
jgi:hypothetical protein